MIITTVLGARPQFIKAAAISQAVVEVDGVTEANIHTGQHFDPQMSDVFFRQLGVAEPRYNLGIHGGRHGQQTGRMLETIESTLIEIEPDVVLVHGDTNSTLAGALAAAKLGIPLAHVEAGLRSYNRRMPEEINRVLTDHAADLLFAPTDRAAATLRGEGIDAAKIHVVGDVMYDVCRRIAESDGASSILDQVGVQAGGYLLATIHRAENTDSPETLAAIFQGLARAGAELPVVLPLHPRTEKALREADLLDGARKSLRLIEPVGYLEMAQLTRTAAAVATDSGGLQKESFFFRVPCVTLRTETEWTELVDLGWNRVVAPTSPETIASAALDAVGRKGEEANPYGDGRAAERILELLQSHFQ